MLKDRPQQYNSGSGQVVLSYIEHSITPHWIGYTKKTILENLETNQLYYQDEKDQMIYYNI